jgi:hypothetical protein
MSPSLSGPSIYSGLSSQQKGRGINHEKEGELIMRRKEGGGERERGYGNKEEGIVFQSEQ